MVDKDTFSNIKLTQMFKTKLNELLKYSVMFCKSSTKCLFLKGEKVEDEINEFSKVKQIEKFII